MRKGENLIRENTAIGNIVQSISELFQSTWNLLSETNSFLLRMPRYEQYEPALRNWRMKLQNQSSNQETLKSVREEIVVLRKALRKSGWDVSLGSLDIVCRGFKNDASIREGYARIVLLYTGNDVYWLTGSGNHIGLWEILERETRGVGIIALREYHYLWYVWSGKLLILSGADTEDAASFERLSRLVEVNKLLFLKRLRNLKQKI